VTYGERFFTVMSSKGLAEIEAYLYSHTTVRRFVVDAHGRTHALLKTTTEVGTREAAYDEAGRLAHYQAGRFSSALMSPSQVFEIEADAVSEHAENWAYQSEAKVPSLANALETDLTR
jgi:hypothetical protein